MVLFICLFGMKATVCLFVRLYLPNCTVVSLDLQLKFPTSEFIKDMQWMVGEISVTITNQIIHSWNPSPIFQ